MKSLLLRYIRAGQSHQRDVGAPMSRTLYVCYKNDRLWPWLFRRCERSYIFVDFFNHKMFGFRQGSKLYKPRSGGDNLYAAYGSLRPKSSTRLFLTIKNPKHDVSKDTISNWCTAMMEKAGIDTSIYDSHSICAAAATASLNYAKSTKEQIEQHRWARGSTAMRKKYIHEGINEEGYALESDLGNQDDSTKT